MTYSKQKESPMADGAEWSTRQVVEDALARAAVDDIDGYLSHLHNDVEYVLHLSKQDAAFAGAIHGKEELRQRMRAAHSEFDFILYRPLHIRIEGLSATARVEFLVRHKASGAELFGRSRLVMQVEQAMIKRVEDFQDSRRFSAFARLISATAGG